MTLCVNEVHRCGVLGVLKATRKVEVHFVDFGNREVVECEELRDMPELILNELPLQAVACSLSGIQQTGSISAWSSADIDTFSSMVSDHLLGVYFTPEQNSDGHHIVHLRLGQEDINRKFLRLANKLSHNYQTPADRKASGDAAMMPSLANRRQSMDSNDVDEKDGFASRGYKFELGMADELLKCVAAYVVSPADFYLHKVSSTGALEEMMDELNADYEKLGAAQTLTVSVGQPCCALYSADDRWYRAKLVSMSNERRRSLSVEFVDYGNTEMVDATNVHRLRSHYFALPVQALHCRLAEVVPVTGSDWSDDAATFFEEQLGDSVTAVKIVSVDDFIHTVEMNSIAQKLVDGNFAKWKSPVPVTLGSTKTVQAQKTGSGSWKHELRQLDMIKTGSREFEAASAPQSHGSYSRLMSGASGGGFAEAAESWGESNDIASGERNDMASAEQQLSFTSLDIAADTRHSVVVSWVVSPSEFYCQLVDNCRDIEKLSKDLRETYQTSKQHTLSASDCAANRSCVAFYEADRSWYRGRIVSCESARVTVFYVDYGNTEVVRVDQVRSVTAQFMKSPPVQAVKCCLRGADQRASEWTKDETSAFDRAMSTPQLTCRFISKQNDVYAVELQDQTGHDLTSQFCSKPTAAVAGATREQGLSPKMTMKACEQYQHECGLKVNDVVQLEVVYVADGSSVFNCHVVGQTAELDELMTELGKDCEHCPPLSSLDIGQPCVAMYSEDSTWYRATIDSIPADDDTSRMVKFVDYGNVESCSVSSLRELGSRFLRVPVRRVDCRLRGMTAASLDDVIDDLLAQQFTATVVAVDTSSNIVTVELRTIDTEESFETTHPELFTRRTAVSLPAVQPPQGEVDVYISHVVSPSDLYIQTASVEAQLTELVDQLIEVYDADGADELTLSELTVGSLCCARYLSDESWYRAVVEDIRNDVVSVRFIDYGNTDDVCRSDIRRLTDNFTSVPACAWHCQLAAVSSQSSWTDAERQKMVELAAAGEKLFVCTFVSQSQLPYPVTLKDDGIDIGQQLFGSSLQPADMSTSEQASGGIVPGAVSELAAAEPPSDAAEVCVTCAESPSDFYIQLTSVEDELSQLANELVDEYDSLSASDCQLPSVEVGSLCCARYSADAAWYRAVITEIVGDTEVRVLFTDYGNTDVVSTSTDVKLLSQKFCATPAFVYHCGLAGVRQRAADEWTDEVKSRFTELVTSEEQVFTCRFVSQDADSGRHLVSLTSAEEVDVCSLVGITPDVNESVDAPQIAPHVVSSGKHKVSIVSLNSGVQNPQFWKNITQNISCTRVPIFPAFSALMLLVVWQEGHLACKKTEWCNAGVVVSGSSCRFAYGQADATATHCLLLQ